MTPNNRSLKAYARFDGTGRIVPGSLVLRRNKPKVGTWTEVTAYECCVPSTCAEPLVMEVIPLEGFFDFGFRVNDPNTVKGTIDWGDGTSSSFNLTGDSGYFYFNHNYTTPDYIPHTVKVFFDSVTGFGNLEIGDTDGWHVLSVSNISTVFAGSSINQVDADGSLLGSLDVSNLPITQLYALECPNLTFLNVQGCTLLDNTQLYNDNFETLDFSGCTSLVSAEIYDNPNLTTVVIDDCPIITTLDIRNSGLTEANVNYLLVTLDNNGLTGGVIDLRGGTNGSPSGAGLTAKTNLEGKSWYVGVN